MDQDGAIACSVCRQGARLVNAYDAVYSDASACANRGMEIDADLDGTIHSGGPANQDEDGNSHIMGMDGSMWLDNLAGPATVNVWVEQE